MSDHYYEIAGFAGVGFYILAYALLQFGILKGSGYAYTAMNLAAASLVLISLAQHFNLYSAMIQVFWITLSVIGLSRLWMLNRRISFTDEEKRFLQTMLPGLSDISAHRLLQAGHWHNANSGDVIAREGTPVEAVSYIDRGSASVSLNGTEFTRLGKGDLVGEMTWNSDDMASATVTLTEQSELFTIPAASLRALCNADPELAEAVHRMVAHDTVRKLKSANVTMAASPA